MTSPQILKDKQAKLYQLLLFVAGCCYLLWWFTTEYLLPGSFNPFPSRALTVSLCFLTLLGSFYLNFISENIGAWFLTSVGLITIHYFYLFFGNNSDINWVVGSYITVIAVSACLQTATLLRIYCILVLFLSLGLCYLQRALLETIFLPGMITILAVSYLGLKARLKLVSQVQESAQRLQSLFDAAVEGITVHDKGTIIDANESMAKMFGYERKEVIGRSTLDFVAPEFKDTVQDRINSMSETPYEINGVRKDGMLIPLEIRGKTQSTGAKVLRVTTIQDLTERKKSEENRILYKATKETLRIRDEFITIAAHELKTPLTSMKIRTDMTKLSIARGDPNAFSPTAITKLIQQTDQQLNQLISLVDNMLNISNISLGQLRIEKADTNFSVFLESVVQSLSDVFERAHCEVQMQIQPGLLAKIDQARMEQVVTNLLTNATRYGKAKPILIQLDKINQELRLLIQDHGIGIAKVDHLRIFERFGRTSDPNYTSGLGLGLYICKEIIEDHHGHIRLESELDQGAKFIVTLPLVSITANTT